MERWALMVQEWLLVIRVKFHNKDISQGLILCDLLWYIGFVVSTGFIPAFLWTVRSGWFKQTLPTLPYLDVSYATGSGNSKP